MKTTTKRKIGLAGGALALASIGIGALKTARQGARVEVEQDFPVPSGSVIDLIKQVERETEFVPTVSSVEIIDRRDDEVTYEVFSRIPVPWKAVYRKWWDYDGKWVAWKSLTGSFGLVHTGEIRFEDTPGGCKAKLITDYKFKTPVIGTPTTFLSEIGVRAVMAGWMQKLAETLAEKQSQ